MDKEQEDEFKKVEAEIDKEIKDVSGEMLQVPNLDMHQHTDAARARFQIVAEMLLQGYTSRQIMDKFHKEWNISRESVRVNYIQVTRKLMQQEMYMSFEDMVSDIWMKYDYIYKRFFDEDNSWGMKAVLDAKLKMLSNGGINNDDVGPIQVIEINIAKPNKEIDEGKDGETSN